MTANTPWTRRSFVAGSLLLPLVLAGCGGAPATVAAPPEIAYGRDTCDRCGMIVSDERYAAGLVGTDGEAKIFDDAGEMLLSVQAEGLDSRKAWVHDWNSREWLDATTATYVRANPETTPMGTGIIAFGTRKDAESYAAEHEGTILTWEDGTTSTS